MNTFHIFFSTFAYVIGSPLFFRRLGDEKGIRCKSGTDPLL